VRTTDRQSILYKAQDGLLVRFSWKSSILKEKGAKKYYDPPKRLYLSSKLPFDARHVEAGASPFPSHIKCGGIYKNLRGDGSLLSLKNKKHKKKEGNSIEARESSRQEPVGSE